VAPIGPIGAGLHFIPNNEKNKTSKFLIKMKGVGSTIESPNSIRALVSKKRQIAPFSLIAFKMFSASQNIVSKRVTLHA